MKWTHSKWSKWSAVCSWLLIFILGIVCLFLYLKTFPGVSRNEIVMDFYKQTALNIYIISSNSLASLAILVLTGVWGLILSTGRKNKLKRWDWWTSFAGSVSLIFSFISYRFLLSKHIEILYSAKTIDLTAKIAGFWYIWQVIFFFIGFGIFAVFFLQLQTKGDEG